MVVGLSLSPFRLTIIAKVTLQMRDTTKTLMKALTQHIATKIKTGQESLVHQEAVRRAFQESMGERIAPMLKAAAKLQREQGFPHYLQCVGDHMATTAQDESVIDAVNHVAAGVAKDGLGVDTKAIGRVVRALRKKKPKTLVSKVPTNKTPKVKAHSVRAIAPVSMDRKEIAKHLRTSGNDLRKITAKDLT
jgi:hypothetical protein